MFLRSTLTRTQVYELRYTLYINVCFFRKKKLMRYCGDFEEKDLETPRKRKLFWNIYQRTNQIKQKKIKVLKQKNLRLKLKVNTLNNLVDDLQRKNKITANCSHLLKVYMSHYTVTFMTTLKISNCSL